VMLEPETTKHEKDKNENAEMDERFQVIPNDSYNSDISSSKYNEILDFIPTNNSINPKYFKFGSTSLSEYSDEYDLSFNQESIRIAVNGETNQRIFGFYENKNGYLY